MTELERRALLGDRKAQEECTRRGIMLKCPCCGKEKIRECYFSGDYWYGCKECDCSTGLHSSKETALAEWNTRPAPPVGRCVECAAYVDSKCANTGYYKSETGFCDDFAPKEDT